VRRRRSIAGSDLHPSVITRLFEDDLLRITELTSNYGEDGGEDVVETGNLRGVIHLTSLGEKSKKENTHVKE